MPTDPQNPPPRQLNRKRTFPRGEIDALTALSSPNEDVAREALGYLFDGSRTSLDRYLQSSCKISDPQIRADVSQSTYVRLWQHRATFENKGDSAWRGWLQRTASRCYLDSLRAQRKLASDEEFDLYAVPADERSIVDAVLTAVESEELFQIADRLFLELDPRFSAQQHGRRLLAAQLFYIDGERWETVLRLLGSSPGESALTRQDLDEWLADPGVLRHLAFRTLFYDKDLLTAHLLGWPESLSREERALALDQLMQSSQSADKDAICDAAGNGLVWGAVLVLLWRFRNALLNDQILTRSDLPLTNLQFDALMVQCLTDFPFRARMQDLVAKLGPGVGAQTLKAFFGTPSVWQRLALEYRLREDLPHRDIQDRLRPAANVVGYDVTAGMLNVWLSNGRLVKRLAQSYEDEHGDIEERGKND